MEPELTPEEAEHLLTVYALSQEVLRRAGVAAPDEPNSALDKLSRLASNQEGDD